MTKYKANRSFAEHYGRNVAAVLEYDQVTTYTAELFNRYMDYKLLLKHLQSIITNRDDFKINYDVGHALVSV